MKSKLVSSNNLNNIIFILLLLVVVIVICCKSISIHNNITEQFENNNKNNNKNNNNDNNTNDNNTNDNNTNDNKTNDNIEAEITEELNNQIKKISGDYNQEDDEDETNLVKKCEQLDLGSFGSVTSKYSGKTINVESLPPVKGSKRKYMIQWQPVGGKPGGCITANADGTYSTPICNANINKQQWFIKEIKDEEQYLKLIPKDRRNMGRSIDETEFPFHVIQSSEYENYCLHYEGGGLAIREIANYDSQKWDVSKDKIYQDPLPTQSNNKFSGLTPGHKMTNSDKSLGSIGENGDNKEKDPMQFNINVDPDLLNKLGIKTGMGSNGMGSNGMGGNGMGSNGMGSNGMGSNGMGSNGMGSNGMGSKKEKDLLIYDDENSINKKQDNSDMMVNYNGNEEICNDCGKIPDNMIKKDLVKSMCIGCNNIDNVLE